VQLLLENGANVRTEQGLEAAEKAVFHPEVVKTLLDAGAKVTLIVAASLGDLAKVRELIIQGADVNAKKGPHFETPLMIAAYWGHLEVVKLLLDKGADVNEKLESGMTALAYAAGEPHWEVVKLLLDKGADVNYKPHDNDSETALNIARKQGYTHIVEILKARGAKE